MLGSTKIWKLSEFPGYELEQTPGLWILWGICNDTREECSFCGGTGSKIIETCGQLSGGAPADPNMVNNYFNVTSWTPVRSTRDSPYDTERGITEKEIEKAMEAIDRNSIQRRSKC